MEESVAAALSDKNKFNVLIAIQSTRRAIDAARSNFRSVCDQHRKHMREMNDKLKALDSTYDTGDFDPDLFDVARSDA